MKNNKEQKIKLVTVFLGIYLLIIPLNAFTISSFSIVRFFVIIPAFLSLLYKNKSRKKYRNSIIMLLICFISACLIQIVYSPFSKIALSNSLQLLMYFSFVFLVTKLDYNEREKKYINTMFFLSSWFCLLLTLFFKYSFFNYRLTLKFPFGGIEDPNYYCGYFIPGIIKSIDSLLNCKRKISIKNFVFLTSFVLMMFLCLLSGSRGGLLAIIVGIIACVFNIKEKVPLKKIIIITLRIVLILFVLYFGYIYLSKYLNIGILNRLSLETISETNGNGRYDIWNYLLNLYSNFSIPLKIFGYGIGSTYATIAAAHNMWITLLFENGIYGLIIIALIFLNLFKISFENDSKYYFIILISYLVLSLTLSIIFYKPLWSIIIAILINEKIKGDEKIE